MMSSQESIKIQDLDTGEAVTIPKSTGIPIDFAISLEENIVYWVNNMQEIFSSRINGSGHHKLLSTNESVSSICVDWISRALFFTQVTTQQDSYVIYRAALPPGGGRPYVTSILTRPKPIYSLQVAPLHQSLFWYEETGTLGLGTLMMSHINGSNIRPYFNSTKKQDSHECNCSENPQVAKSFVVDMTKGDNYEVYWIDPWIHRIIATDMRGCKCRLVVDATEKKKYGFTPMSITVDSKYVYWYNSTEREIYYTNKYKYTKIEHAKITYGYKIMTLDPSNQKYPPRSCLLPKLHTIEPKMISNSASSITLRIPPIEKPNLPICPSLNYEMSLPEYTIFYINETQDDTFTCHKESCPFVTSSNSEVILSDLKPFTNYTVTVEATNYYAKLYEMKPIVGSPLILQTAAEAPEAPQNVTAVALNPERVLVKWLPVPGLTYRVHWKTEIVNNEQHLRDLIGENGSTELKVAANTTYLVWVSARSPHSSVPAESPPRRLTTYPLPANIQLVAAEPRALRVAWSPPDYPIHKYIVQYAKTSTPLGEWYNCDVISHNISVARHLRPFMRYRFRLQLRYHPGGSDYYWPDDDSFTFQTLATVPGKPGRATVAPIVENSVIIRIQWEQADSHGSNVTNYRVWGLPTNRTHDRSVFNMNKTLNGSEVLPAYLPSDIDDYLKNRIITEGLQLLQNVTEPSWLVLVDDFPSGYSVEIQGRNKYGWGPLSPSAPLRKPDFAQTPSTASKSRPGIALAAAAAVILFLLVVAVVISYVAYKNCTKKKTVPESPIATYPPRSHDHELETLRNPPPLFPNILYNRGCPLSDAEINSLPRIPRDKITLNKFLGSGAFGEVYQGVARQLNGTTADTKVAVKTLRKGATNQEKDEFLKEAALMANFKHEHILKLLGVCLDNDPHYIIMELMEGGDLLSYLRSKRASLYTPESLNLLDLLNMCVDVTKGCLYLEEMHFVHRDLACRNCLVNLRPNGRQVKIGDFGLARDIYNNDYYRKEGEGMLPVRWMAVECLVDGIFTCHSDVWAWGVLCWEVLSLGQQPYPAQTNRQVLSYVRSGGKPDRPPNCPSAFYELLLKCWSFNREARPSFRECLAEVAALRDKTSPRITLTATPAPAHHYLTLLPDACSDAVDNRTYLLDENANACLDEESEHDMEPSRLLPPASTSKYLELMYDSDSAPGSVACDGYEIPRTTLAYMPFARHSIVGVAPNRLIKPIYRTHSLRATTRPLNATITPLRNGISKRSSLCEELRGNYAGPSQTHRPPQTPTLDLDRENLKTPF